MNTEFRNRAFLPVVLPIALLLGIALLVASFALILLYTTHEVALVLATVAAAGILLAFSLASSQDRLDPGKKAVVVFAGAFPIVAGAVIAVTQPVDASLLNINREPHLAIPEDAPLLAAEDALNFCLPTEDGGCEVVDRWEVTPSQQVEDFAYFFNNLDTATGPHNLALFELAGSDDAPEPGAAVFVPDPFEAPDTRGYVVEETEVPSTFYFMCTVHPNMNGVGVIAGENGEAGPADQSEIGDSAENIEGESTGDQEGQTEAGADGAADAEETDEGLPNTTEDEGTTGE